MVPHLRAVVPALALVLGLGVPARRQRANRSRQQLQVQLRAGHPARVRGLVEKPRRHVRHAFRLPEPKLGSGAFRSSRPNNSIEPGGPDRGQPTFFYTRTQRNLFSVSVPRDFGKKELIWTITANGKTQKAFGWLQPEWEIDPAGGATAGGQTSPELRNNKPPTITIELRQLHCRRADDAAEGSGCGRRHSQAGGTEEAGGRSGNAARSRHHQRRAGQPSAARASPPRRRRWGRRSARSLRDMDGVARSGKRAV